MTEVEKPWQDEKWLRQKTIEEGINSNQLAKEYDISPTGVRYWMKKYDIPRGEHTRIEFTEDELRELYYEKRMTTKEISKLKGCSRQTVTNHMMRHGLDTRGNTAYRSLSRGGDGTGVSHRISHKGYEVCATNVNIDGEMAAKKIPIHRLIAVAEHGFDAVKDKHVHHVNFCSWDNRPENLELMDNSEHLSYHARVREGDEDKPWIEHEDYDGYSKEDMSTESTRHYSAKRR